MPRVQIVDPRGAELIAPGAVPERIFTGAIWAEGPLVLPWDGALIFSDIPNDRIRRIGRDGSASVYRQPADFSNGRTLDRDGAIITCEHGTRRVTRTARDGTVTVIADRHDGRRLNSPNDVVVKADGSIWFTDPPYGIDSDHEGHKATSEQDGNNVYRVQGGVVSVVASDFDRPNGLAFSPDERLLYIADSGALMGAGHPEFFVPTRPHHIRVFDVASDGALSGGRVFAVIDVGVPDGLRVDAAGRVWTSAGDGVRCYDPDGLLLLKVLLPETASNLTFDGGTMFITATTSVYRIGIR